MGNTLCFGDQKDDEPKQGQGRTMGQIQNVHSELFLLTNQSSDTSTNDISQKNSKKLSCPFCQEILDSLQTTEYSNEFRNCSSENNRQYILDLLNIKNADFIYHPYLEQEILKIESAQSFYRLKFPLLIKDDITQITASWFHLNLLQPKMIMELEDYEENSKEYQLLKELDTLQHTKLSNLDQAILISLRWVLIENFCPQTHNCVFSQIENNLLRRAYQLYQQIYHFCISFKIQFEQIYYQPQQVKAYDMLYIYVNLWNKYEEFMQTIIQQWELLADGIQIAYRIQFDQQDDRVPHFKFHGIMARFWCQIILSDPRLQQVLKQSFQKLLDYLVVGEMEQKIVSKSNTFQLFSSESQILEIMKLFVNSIVDVSIEEASVHVIGHSKYSTIHDIFYYICQISDFLIDIKIYDEKGFGLESFQKSNQIMSKLQTIYPQWYFDEIEEKCYEKLRIIKNKILSKPKQSKQEIKLKIDKSTEFLNEKLSQIGKYGSPDTQNTASTNQLQISQKTVTMSTSDTQKATTASVFNTLLFDSQETALQSQQIIHPDLNEIIEMIEQRRKQVKVNKEYREKIIENRCQQYKIPIDRKMNDLNFFKSKDLTTLIKLSPTMMEGMKILIEQRIKKIKTNKDLSNKEKVQLEEFEKLLKR